MMRHQPVMTREVLEYLRPVRGTVVDACVGTAGHARPILEALASSSGASRERPGGAECREQTARTGDRSSEPRRRPSGLLGIDCDPEALSSARRQLGDYSNFELVHASYVDMPALVCRLGLGPVTGVLFDFGASLDQLKSATRGFSIDSDSAIDMRFDPTAPTPTTLDLIRRASERTLREWFRAFGQEPMSGRVARVIYATRHQLRTTGDLVRAVRSVVPRRLARKALARVFQALRIVTNDELGNIRRGLAAALEILVPTGRLVALSYHSLEDVEVKRFFRAGRTAGRLRVLTPKPVRPRPEEVAHNPRSRSARLRAAEVIV